MSQVQPEPPSGKQYEIRHGDQRAVIVEVGAGVREYFKSDRPVLDGYRLEEICTAARGATLAPWPNRLADGNYEFKGQTLQTALTEPEKHNAIHGLARWMNWVAADHRQDSVRMELLLHAQTGYPFNVMLSVEYRLSDEGLSVTTGGRNLGSSEAPFGFGHHPYVTLGTQSVEQMVLQHPAASYLELDQRQNASGRLLKTEGTPYDFRQARLIGETKLDTAFAEPERDTSGLAWIVVEAEGRPQRIRFWMDYSYPFFMIFTADTVPEPQRRRKSLGLEPMSCAPNAFRTGQGLKLLAPGESFQAAWGIAF
jgi:aldose 1-epimerase